MTADKGRLHEILREQPDLKDDVRKIAEELSQHHHETPNNMMASYANELLKGYDEEIPYDLEITTTQHGGHVRVQSKQDVTDYRNYACSQQALESCYIGTQGYDMDELQSVILSQIVRVTADAINTWENHYLGQ